MSRKELILNVVKEVPAVSYNEIVRATNLSNGVVTHYILQLIEKGELIKFGDGRPKYFHYKIPKNDMKIITILRNPTNREIVNSLLMSKLELSSYDIAKKIKKSKSTVSVSLKVLQKSGIVERKILNKKTKITSDIGYLISNKRFFEKFFADYNI